MLEPNAHKQRFANEESILSRLAGFAFYLSALKARIQMHLPVSYFQLLTFASQDTGKGLTGHSFLGTLLSLAQNKKSLSTSCNMGQVVFAT